MPILILVLSLLAPAPARAQLDFGAVQAQMRDILRGRPAPAGIAAPKLTGAALTAPARFMDNKAADFTLKDLSGKEVSLSQYAGKYVLLDFSATWCGPCNASIPKLQELQNNALYKEKGLVVLAVYSEDAETVRGHMKDHGASYPILIDSDKKVSGSYLVAKYPTFFLIGPDRSKLGMGMGQWGIDPLIAKFKKAVGL